MEIKYHDIILRDRKESDIDDDIRWNTVETQWALWDAPWEMEEELPKFDPAAYRAKALEWLKKQKEGFRWHFEVDTAQGDHIGGVNAYLVDSQYNWISLLDAEKRPEETFHRTLGLDLNESRFWGRGLGTQVLTAFIRYHLDSGLTDLYLQTWSGNGRMIHVAKKLGFVECRRKTGIRQVRGETYDGLTFRLDVEAFHSTLCE